jgi:hypothetical protein
MMVLGVDPGEKNSAYVLWRYDIGQVIGFGELPNTELIARLREPFRLWCDKIAVEVIRGYGLRTGNETYLSCQWAGRFLEAYESRGAQGFEVQRKTKQGYVHHFCGHDGAGDTGLYAALKDRFGDPGTKKAPGIMYGLKSTHLRAAFAVAVFIADQVKERG